MISSIRSYFKEVLKVIDPKLSASDHPILTDITSNNVKKNTYDILIGDLSNSPIEDAIDGEFSVTVCFYKNGGNKDETIKKFDSAYCKAIDIQALACYKKQIGTNNDIKDVQSSSVVPDTVLNNDNLFKFTIQFEVSVNYAYTI